MKPHPFVLALGLVLSSASLFACGGDGIDTETGAPAAESEAVSSLELSGDVEVKRYEAAPIVVTARLADGTTRDVTRDAALSWIVEDPDVAVVDAEGMVKGINVGATRVHASLADTVSAPQTVVVH